MAHFEREFWQRSKDGDGSPAPFTDEGLERLPTIARTWRARRAGARERAAFRDVIAQAKAAAAVEAHRLRGRSPRARREAQERRGPPRTAPLPIGAWAMHRAGARAQGPA